MINVTGKNVLVTGGTRGIGKAIVEVLADAGCNVAFTYRSSSDTAHELVQSLEGKGVKAKAYQADAGDFTKANQVMDDLLNEWGQLDILINNAGVTRDGLMLRMSEADFDAVIEANLKSVFNYTKAALKPMMRQRAGKIINISSVVGVMGNAGQANYAASKAGIIGFSKSIAKEVASRNITCNVVAPGWIQTEMTEDLSEDAKMAFLSSIPLKKAGSTQDVAGICLFLSSSLSDYMTGQVIHIDGGMVM